ncbi:glycosyltransferase family 2 protein [Erythrobacter sp.]|jgi:glycosyltransferase involved in cell wall biosynthesis|uniref:glycosyltransferase family 2 protein n=1 Tax=Erythrobacter sp. TaxID=1042 RepID=UPI002ECF0373|nr:glycosyltransferase family 2 protein [Erythrobacter sp.]
MEKNMSPAVSVAITRYAESDRLLARSVSAALGQEGVTGEVILVDQRVDRPFDFSLVTNGNLELRILRQKCESLSHARNLCLDEAAHDLVLFLDADAIARPDWAVAIADALSESSVAIAGSRILPEWEIVPPAFARGAIAKDQYSMLDLGMGDGPAHKIVGAAFGVHRGKLARGMRFDVTLGRRDGRLFGGEESDFFRRVVKAGWKGRYVGRSHVMHLVARERLRLGWLIERMFYAGYGRSAQGGAPAPSRKPNIYDWLFAPVLLPAYIAGWSWAKLMRGTVRNV